LIFASEGISFNNGIKSFDKYIITLLYSY